MPENPRPRIPNAADMNIMLPPKTSSAIRNASGLSMCCFIYLLYGQRGEREDDAREGKDDGKHPIPHDHLLPRPSHCLEMMMEGRNPQEFASKEFLGKNLRHVGDDRHHEQASDDGQYGNADSAAEVVGHKCDSANREGEPHGPRIAHIKSRRRNIEPEKGEQSPHDAGGECGEAYLIL